MSDFIRVQCIAPHQINKKDYRFLAYEVNKIGHNMNQIAKRIHIEKKLDILVLGEMRKIDGKLTEVLKKPRVQEC
jgi:hypothetical protein